MVVHREYSELVKNIRANDKVSFEILFKLLYTRLRNFANTMINSKPDAEDIVQEIFLNLWKNRSALDESKSLESYLFISTRNRCLNWLKHQKSENEYARIMALVYYNAVDEHTPHEAAVGEDIEKDFYKVLDDLPTQCRKIFELNRFEGLKYHEIATKLNISIKTVEMQMSRALVKIRFQLKKHTGSIHLFLFCLLN